MEDFSTYLEKIRKKLLDLTLRNRFLNFRFTQANAFRLTTVGIDTLVEAISKEKPCNLLPLPKPDLKTIRQYGLIGPEKLEYPDELVEYTLDDINIKLYAEKVLGLNVNDEIPENISTSGLSQKGLLTLFFPEKLDTRLTKIYRAAHLAIEERGTPITYLACGFLEWTEKEESKKKILSPLYLVPIQIKKSSSSRQRAYDYSIYSGGEEARSNTTLQEYMKSIFHIELPQIEEDEKPSAYFTRVRKVIQNSGKNWKVRQYVSIALLDFSKLSMYRDLNPDSWSGRSLLQNSLVNLIISGGDEKGESRDDAMSDLHKIPGLDKSLPLVLDADSSQLSAIIDAVHGQNMVIVGPPGTGKSQTITNLIAALLFEGKTVLFASDKLAALKVVKSKLDSLGLGDFCLELHSNKGDKIQLRESLKDRLSASHSVCSENQIELFYESYEKRKKALNEYADLMATPVGKTGLTIQEVLAKATHYAMKVEQPWKLRPEAFKSQQALDLLSADYVENIEEIARQGEILLDRCELRSTSEHPWYGITCSDDSQSRTDRILSSLRQFNETAKQFVQFKGNAASQMNISENRLAKGTVLNCLDKQLPLWNNIRENKYFENISELCQKFQGNPEIIKEYTEILELLETAILCIDSVVDQDGLNTLDVQKIKQGIYELKNRVKPTTTLSEIEKLTFEIQALETEYRDLREQISGLFRILGLNSYLNEKVVSWRALARVIEKLGNLPFLRELDVPQYQRELMSKQFDDFARLVQDVRKYKEQAEISFKLEQCPDISRITTTSGILKQKKSWGIFAFLSGEWRRSRNEFSTYINGDIDEALKNVDALKSYLQLNKQLESSNFKNAFGVYHQGLETDLDALKIHLEWHQTLDALIEELPVTVRKDFYKIHYIDHRAASELQRCNATGIHEAFRAFINQLEKIKQKLSLSTLTGQPNEFSIFKERENLLASLSLVASLNIPGMVFTVARIETIANSVLDYRKYFDRWSKHEITSLLFTSSDAARLFEKGYLKLCYKEITSIDNFLNSFQLPELICVRNWVYSTIENNPKGVLEVIGLFSRLNSEYQGYCAAKADFVRAGEVLPIWFSGEEQSFSEVVKRNNLALEHESDLSLWLGFLKPWRIAQKNKLGDFIEKVQTRHINMAKISEAYLAMCFEWIADSLIKQHPLLRDFSSLQQVSLKNKFIKLDHELKKISCQRIKNSLIHRHVPEGQRGARVGDYTELQLIRHECNKKTRHIANRDLFDRAGLAIQALKPCFMMSPLSIAQSLEPNGLTFDVVVMDEASQLTPEAAIGVIARGAQVVIVGDPKQLPPTNFFNRTNLYEEDEDADEVATIQEAESILDQALNHLHNRSLLWHYRSRHQSLIAFSNRMFYNNRLFLFPSPFEKHPDYGVKACYVANGVFDENRRNVPEAEAIARAAIDLLNRRTGESFGIVAMNESQRECIQYYFDMLVHQDSQAFAALEKNESGEDPYFIKNLENVQGDERDVIFVSCTYGPQSIGGRVPQRFGPINQDNGWRRLNVLLTRAKKRMHIFSSMKVGDVLDNGRQGPKALAAFLRYCFEGYLPPVTINEDTGRGPDSDFEVAVMDGLRARGYDCVPQVGVAGFYIDLAVRDPRQPNTFLLGIECDGASYHSSRTARDRDRLRQEVLEGLGWEIHRIWSTDWFKHPKQEIDEVVRKLLKMANKKPIYTERINDDVTVVEVEPTNNIGQEEHNENDFESSGDLELKQRLTKLGEEIKKVFPTTEEKAQLLSPQMITYFIENQPMDKEEFRETCPLVFRSHLSKEEVDRYLEKVLEVIRTY